MLQEAQAAYKYQDQVKSYVELVENTIRTLERFLDVSNNGCNIIFWENLLCQYRLISVAFNDILLHRSRLSVIICGKDDFITNSLQGRSRFNVAAETPEELRRIGFEWKKISKIFGVS